MLGGGNSGGKTLSRTQVHPSPSLKERECCEQSGRNLENAEVIIFRGGTIGWLAQFVPVGTGNSKQFWRCVDTGTL